MNDEELDDSVSPMMEEREKDMNITEVNDSNYDVAEDIYVFDYLKKHGFLVSALSRTKREEKCGTCAKILFLNFNGRAHECWSHVCVH